MAMNGIVSTSMREKGMGYRVNFGLTLPLIRNIAESYVPNAKLAHYLWKEQVRESKMLATWLYPLNEMTPEIAQEWVEEIPYPEIADVCCMNLFAKLPFASQKAAEWITSDKDIIRYTGYQLFNRLMMYDTYPDNETEKNLINSVVKSPDNSPIIQMAGLNCIKRLIHGNPGTAERIAKNFSDILKTGTVIQKKLSEEILQEYEFYRDELSRKQGK